MLGLIPWEITVWPEMARSLSHTHWVSLETPSLNQRSEVAPAVFARGTEVPGLGQNAGAIRRPRLAHPAAEAQLAYRVVLVAIQPVQVSEEGR